MRAIADRIDNLYYIREEKKNHQIKFVEKSISKINLWHKRFGHLNENDLKKLKSSNSVLGLKFPNENLSTCEVCLKGKVNKSFFFFFF